MIHRSLILAVALSAQGFAQTFSTPVFTPIQPETPYLYDGAGPRPTMADFSGDGLPDVLVSDHNGLRVALGNGAGGFTGYVYTQVPLINAGGISNPWILGVSDLNGDGLPDVVASANGGGIRTFLNLGAATFGMSAAALPLPPSMWAPPRFVDLDGMPPDELVMAGYDLSPFPGGEVIRIYAYDVVANAFSLNQTIVQPLYETVVGLACGDFNGDALPDIATVGGNSLFLGLPPVAPILRLHLNAGGLTFAPSVTFPVPPPPGLPFGVNASHSDTYESCAGDVTGDGIDDLVFVEALPTATAQYCVWIYPGNPATGLGPPVVRLQPASGPPSGSLNVLADFDDDGVPDLCVDSDIVRTLPAWSIGAPLTFPVTAGLASHRAVGDLNLDGTPDVVFIPSLWNAAQTSYTLHIGAALNLARLRPSCGLPTTFSIGTPNPGNPSFAFTLGGALPNVPVALGVSTAEASQGVPWCSVRIDVSPAALVLPTPAGLGIMTSSATGTASLALPIPNIPGIAFTPFFAQWFVLDPNGPLPAGPGLAFSASMTRQIVVW